MPVKRQVLFVQGGGKGVHDEWDSRLVESLRRELGQGYDVIYPRMPKEDDPNYAAWSTKLDTLLESLPDGALLVAHSLGAAILLKALSEHAPRSVLAGIFLIAAPFVGEGGWTADELKLPTDLGAHLPRNVPIHFFHGLEDEVAPPSHVELYASAIPRAEINRLSGRDHQLNDDLSEIAAVISSLAAS